MKILLVGNGGREHALAWKLASCKGVKLLITLGNGGTDGLAMPVPVEPNDLGGLVETAKKERIDLTVVGPESPLAQGLADKMRAEGVPVFGPVQAAARIEFSKAFAHEVMEAAQVPCAQAVVFDDARAALAYVARSQSPLVIKADGLAAGKGVVVAANREEAIETVKRFMVDGALGAAGRKVVIEERLEGDEASFMVLTDGETILPLPPARDHKRLLDGDLGPNTGGMGAFSPTRALPKEAQEEVISRIIRPTLDELARRGVRYQGVLYAGLMMTRDQGPKVLEFNCRFGDPETQAVLVRMRGNLAEILQACAEGRLSEVQVGFFAKVAVCVVLASNGYPGRSRTGEVIYGLDQISTMPNVRVFHAGTRRRPDGALVTNGGRVLGVTAVADSLRAARALAYEAAGRIHFEGMQYRRDIGVQRCSARTVRSGD